jgi:hypothetical protein
MLHVPFAGSALLMLHVPVAGSALFTYSRTSSALSTHLWMFEVFLIA